MKKLSWTQRIALAEGIKAGKSNAQIAREIGVHRSTVGREIARNADSRESYAPVEADLRFWYRQQEAMPKRFLITFCGVEFYSKLQRRNRIYVYSSRTHLNKLSRPYDAMGNSWESTYLQLDKNRFMPDHAFMRVSVEWFPAITFTQGFFGSQVSNPVPTHAIPSPFRPGVSTQSFLKPLSSQSSARMPLLAVSRLTPSSSKQEHPGQIVYEVPGDGNAPLDFFRQKNVVSPFSVHRNQNRLLDVIFLEKIKIYEQNMTFNLLTQDPLSVKI